MGDTVCPSLVGILCVIQSASRIRTPRHFQGSTAQSRPPVTLAL